MEINPLAEVCAELKRQLTSLQQNEMVITRELEWYSTFNFAALEERQRHDESKGAVLEQHIQAIGNELQEAQARLAKLTPAIGTVFNPLNWFAKDQVALRRKRSELCAITKKLTSQQQSLLSDHTSTKERVAEALRELERYRTFDAPFRQTELARLKRAVEDKSKELVLAEARKWRVDETLAPILTEMQHLLEKKCSAQSDLENAETLDRDLSAAGNSYERALIHEECEQRFGTGSPRKIIGERQREIRQLERDHEKARRRAEAVAHTASRRIDTVIIDGNNLCYEDNRFIGLVAIEALLPLLCRMCEVVVIFDSAIRRLLNTDDSSLQRRFVDYAKVHVVASRRQADETVLDLAATSEFSYVLSNDRFSDFNDKAVVRRGRIIRHEIVNGNIFVHDLQLRETYG